MEPKLKICGMKDPENIQEIAALLPDFLGFIFWEPSRRFCNLETLPDLPENIQKVGVFVNPGLMEVFLTVKKKQLDYIQLHGNEKPEFCKKLKKLDIKIIKAFSVDENFDFKIMKKYLDAADYFLLDTKSKNPGGNGVTFDWKLLEQYPYDKPYFLSGGIGLEQVKQLETFLKTKAAQHCLAVDINSRFETAPGIKNVEQLNQFQQQINTF
ncbi:N-(5'-phosphoribosyl)anthranilate isomerase [Flavobacterium sediminis]|uniref:N-(5'-phosphoribosyl)anthranilate isomerase n=1 Tax=Flavobacterium sediminis TaxID=2201181 RepID=A0A2U8QXN3_9FLAO|nr:phosphoribosylanthranilate isomerase [Flavobacterium sediminis]AWM14819.1 N-(5'-phosphoribosyl)anthranilate isomerase [Flavobacterium sediminis]